MCQEPPALRGSSNIISLTRFIVSKEKIKGPGAIMGEELVVHRGVSKLKLDSLI